MNRNFLIFSLMLALITVFNVNAQEKRVAILVQPNVYNGETTPGVTPTYNEDGYNPASHNRLMEAFEGMSCDLIAGSANTGNNFVFENLTADAQKALQDVLDVLKEYDLIVVSPGILPNNHLLLALRTLVGEKPILNMRAACYQHSNGRWGWGISTNPNNIAPGNSDPDIVVPKHLQNHPIFDGITFNGTSLRMYEPTKLSRHSLLYVRDINWKGANSNWNEEWDKHSHTLATFAVSDPDLLHIGGGVNIHEITANPAAKYLLFGVNPNENGLVNLSDDAIRLFRNAAEYLMSDQTPYDYENNQPTITEGFVNLVNIKFNDPDKLETKEVATSLGARPLGAVYTEKDDMPAVNLFSSNATDANVPRIISIEDANEIEKQLMENHGVTGALLFASTNEMVEIEFEKPLNRLIVHALSPSAELLVTCMKYPETIDGVRASTGVLWQERVVVDADGYATLEKRGNVSFDEPSIIRISRRGNSYAYLSQIYAEYQGEAKTIAMLVHPDVIGFDGYTQESHDRFMKAFEGFDLTEIPASAVASDPSFDDPPATVPTEEEIREMFADYDIIVVSPGVQPNNHSLMGLRTLVGEKPILNLRGDSYTNNGRWGWGIATNPSNLAPHNGSPKIVVPKNYQNHPIFNGVDFDGVSLKMFSTENGFRPNVNSFLFIRQLGWETLSQSRWNSDWNDYSHTLATFALNDPDPDIAGGNVNIHEVTVNPQAKYLMIGLDPNENSLKFLSDIAIQLIRNSVMYLGTPVSAYDYANNQPTIYEGEVDVCEINFDDPQKHVKDVKVTAILNVDNLPAYVDVNGGYYTENEDLPVVTTYVASSTQEHVSSIVTASDETHKNMLESCGATGALFLGNVDENERIEIAFERPVTKLLVHATGVESAELVVTCLKTPGMTVFWQEVLVLTKEEGDPSAAICAVFEKTGDVSFDEPCIIQIRRRTNNSLYITKIYAETIPVPPGVFLMSFDTQTTDVANPRTIEVTHNSPVANLPTVSRTGYDFGGWFFDADFSGDALVNGETVYDIEGDITVFAKWTAKKYKLNFDVNATDIAPVTDEIEVTYNQPIGALPDTPLLTGHDFGGWFAGSVEYTAETLYRVDGNTTLVARWTAKIFKLQFVTNGAEPIDDKDVTFGENVGALPSVSRTGYDFGGWFFNDDFSGSALTNTTEYNLDANINVYAKWTPKTYKILFNPNGIGATVNPTDLDVTFDQKVGTLPTPVHPGGNQFIGWNTIQNGTGTTYTADTEYTVDGNSTLFAQWGTVQLNTPEIKL